MANSTFHLCFSFIGLLFAVLMVVFSIVVSVNVLGKGCDGTTCQSMLYITTTFLSSKRIETNLGFPVATERDLTDSVQLAVNDPTNATKDKNFRFGHFYECMYTARMADKTCAPTLSLNDYTACMQNNAAVSTALDTCATFPSVGGYSHWPTSEEYLACLWNNPILQNSEVRRASQNVFRACIDQTLWPFFEVPQTIDSPVVFGSYNWGLVLLTGMVVLSSFVVYTSSPWETGVVTKGESSALMRLGILSSGTALVWNIVFFVIFCFVAFRLNGGFQENGGLPTTASTTFITIFGTGAAVLYFLSIVIRPFGRHYRAVRYNAQSNVAAIEVVHGTPDTVQDHESQGLIFKGTFPDSVGPNGELVPGRQYTLSDEDVAQMYTPPLLAIWSDSYMVDFCFFLGLAGVTGQLSTDVAWNLFSIIFVYRLLNMIISRCMSDAFTNNVRLGNTLNTYKNKIVSRPYSIMQPRSTASTVMNQVDSYAHDVHLSPKVIGLSTQLSAAFLYISFMYLVFNEFSVLKDYTAFSLFSILGFAVPEALRLLLHVYYQVSYDGEKMGSVPWMLYNGSYLIWLWDVFFRFLFVAIVLLEASNNPGTFDFLKTQTNTLMRDYIIAYSI